MEVKLKVVNNGRCNLIKFLNILFPVSILFWCYVVPGTNNTSFALFLIFIGSVLVLLQKRRIRIFAIEDRIIIIFAIYIIFNQLVLSLLYSNSSTMILKILLFNNLPAIIAILILSDNLNYNLFYRIYYIVTWIVFIGLLFQSFQVYILHQPTKMIIFPFMSNAISASTYNYINYWYAKTRPSSFFSEPSIYANFMAPIIIISLKNRKYIVAITQSIGILLTTSTTGVILVAVIWLYWAFVCVKKLSYKILLGFVLCLATLLLIRSNIFGNTFRKLVNTNLFANEHTGSSLQIFLQMPWKDRILGVGCGNVEKYLATHHIDMSMIETTVNGYVSSGIGNFIFYGVIGGIIYLLLCFVMIRRSNKWAMLTAVLIMCLSFAQTMSFGLTGVWWFSLYHIIKYEKYDNVLSNTI